MSDWQKGDLALCVSRCKGAGHLALLWSPRVGQVCTVIEVDLFVEDDATCLNFAEDPDYQPNAGFDAIHFRKVTPPAADEFDRETIALMNSKPVRVGEPA
jgi:hypothetical protein